MKEMYSWTSQGFISKQKNGIRDSTSAISFFLVVHLKPTVTFLLVSMAQL